MSAGSPTSRRRETITAGCACIETVRSATDRLGEGVLTPLAQPRPLGFTRHRRDVPPAALALDAGGAFNRDARLGVGLRLASGAPNLDIRHDEEHWQLSGMALEEGQRRSRRLQDDARLQRAANLLVLAERLDLGEHTLA